MFCHAREEENPGMAKDGVLAGKVAFVAGGSSAIIRCDGGSQLMSGSQVARPAAE